MMTEIALAVAAGIFALTLLAVAALLLAGHEIPQWLECVATLLLAVFTLVCCVLLMLPLLRLLEMAVMLWILLAG